MQIISLEPKGLKTATNRCNAYLYSFPCQRTRVWGSNRWEGERSETEIGEIR